MTKKASEGLSSLIQEHRYLNAHLERRNGFMLPAHYEDPAQEALLADGTTVVADVSYTGKIRLAGRAVDPFLYGMFDAELNDLSIVGSAVPALLRGGEEPDDDGSPRYPFEAGESVRCWIVRSGEHEFMLLSRYDQTERLYAWLSEFADVEGQGEQAEDAEDGDVSPDQYIELSDETGSMCALAFSGPLANGILHEMERASTVGDSMGIPESGYLRFLRLDNMPVLTYHASAAAQDRYLLLTSVSYSRSLWRSILSFPEVTPVGYDAARRIFDFL